MEKGWLRARLTPEKRKSPLWCGLADAIESLVSEVVEPILKRIDDRKSFYTMDERDLDRRIAELGQFFALRTASSTSKPLLLTQRLDEIHLKDTDQPLINTFWREFYGLKVAWSPYWAPIDQENYPYGRLFTVETGKDEAELLYGEMFLTSRGVIALNLADVYEIYGDAGTSMAIMELLNDFELYITPLLPRHIVFDGVVITLEVTLVERPEYIWLEEIEGYLHEPVTLKEREEVISVEIDTEIGPIGFLPVAPTHRSDVFRYDDIPADAWITDVWRAPDLFEPGVYIIKDDPGEVEIGFTPENEGNELQYVATEERQDIIETNAMVELDISFEPIPTTFSTGEIAYFDKIPADAWITDLCLVPDIHEPAVNLLYTNSLSLIIKPSPRITSNVLFEVIKPLPRLNANSLSEIIKPLPRINSNELSVMKKGSPQIHNSVLSIMRQI